jgi:D-alanyl-D-alanine carboxypeptidase
MVFQFITKHKLFLRVTFILFLIVISSSSVVLITLNQTRLEEIQPATTKTKSSRQDLLKEASIGALVRVTDSIGVNEIKNLDFQIVTDQGESLLVLINKKIGLPKSFVPNGLVSIESLVSAYSGAQLKSEAAKALKEMFDASKTEAGLNLIVVSSYRSYQDQVNVFNSWVASAGLKSAESFSARAGHSQHQLGTTVDIGAVGKANFNEAFGSGVEGVWLANNSARFGFVLSYPKGKENITGYSYEPWHFRYIGKQNAQKLIESGLILEDFLQKYGTW